MFCRYNFFVLFPLSCKSLLFWTAPWSFFVSAKWNDTWFMKHWLKAVRSLHLLFKQYVLGLFLSQINWPYTCRFISGFYILFHWSMCVCVYANTVLFSLLELCNIVWNQSVMLLTMFFLKTALVVWGLLSFLINLRFVCYTSVRNSMQFW